MRKASGFTLIELLAVIVILGIILSIAITSTGDIVSDSTKKAFKVDAQSIISAVKDEMLLDNTFNVSDISVDTLHELLDIPNNNYESIEVSLNDDNDVEITIIGQNKWAGLVATGTYDNMSVMTADEYNSN